MSPTVEGVVADMRVKVGLFATVFVIGQGFDVARLPLGIATGISSPGNGAVYTNKDFFAFLLIDGDTVNQRQERAGFLYFLQQFLFNGGFDVEFLRGIGNVV